MAASTKQIDRTTLKTLEPLNRLNPILLDELANKSIIDEVPAGRIICRHGDKDSRQIYLLSGQIEVASPGAKKSNIIKSKTALTKAIAEGSPRKETLKTKTDSTLLYIDADLLELLMSDGSGTGSVYEVTEIDTDSADGDDWMLTFLQSPAFLQLPTENIQKLLTHLEEIPAKKGQVVIKQGGKDDNYYIIKSGSCNVHRQPHKDSANVLLAVLPTGSGFGEEALISNGTRNATITMREDGSLMRLKKADFLNLLINPLISYFDSSEIQSKIDAGCVVIDVRPETQTKNSPIPNAVNIPLSMLRMEFDNLNAKREYLMFCNDGAQSAAAAFLMIQHGLKCSVLKGGIASIKAKAPKTEAKKPSTADKAKQQVAAAKKQTEQLADQQKQIKAAREKAEQDIIRRKKELEESRARIAQKTKPAQSNEADLLKAQASKELAKAQAQSKAMAEKARKQAEQEAALIKQRALEEAEMLRVEKAEQELAKAQAEREAIEKQQQETNAAMKRAEEMMKQSAAAAEKARKQAELEAEKIKQRALEEAEYLRAEVEASRQKMEQDAARLKEEEQIIKKSALKIKNEADEIRRTALNDAKQVRQEIEETRALLNKRLQQSEAEEKRKHDEILAKAKEQADKIAATKTKQAAAEAEAIRQKAKQDALRLQNELAETRKQIEAEANQVINELKEKSKQTEAAKPEVKVIEEEVLVEVVADVDYKSVSVPGMSTIEPLNDAEAQRKAESIKAKLAQSQENRVKVHKNNDNTILEGDDDLFIFKEPENKPASAPAPEPATPAVSHRTQAEASLTQIPTRIEEPRNSRSVVIYPKQETESMYKNNPLLKNENEKPATADRVQQFDKDAYMKRRPAKSNTMAIAASFLLILAGAVFTLHATNTLKVQSIAALFNSGNDGVQPSTTAIAKGDKKEITKRKVLRADTKVNVKKKVTNKMDDIMQGWQNVLDEAENPKKSK